MHISGFRPSKTPTKCNERTPREGKKKENCGGRREKKSEILGGPAERCPAEGCPAEGCPAEGCHRRRGRKWGAGFGQFRYSGTKTEIEQNKMKRELKEQEKRKVKIQSKRKKKEREKEETEQTPSVRLRPINFDFGQFRLQPISTSANSISASWPKSNCPKSNWPKSSILEQSYLTSRGGVQYRSVIHRCPHTRVRHNDTRRLDQAHANNHTKGWRFVVTSPWM